MPVSSCTSLCKACHADSYELILPFGISKNEEYGVYIPNINFPFDKINPTDV